MSDVFEFGGDPVKVTVEIRGQSRAYFLNDISKEEADKLFEPILRAGENKDKALIANRDLVTAAVAAVVSREDGTKVTLQEARKMRAALVNKLGLKVMAFLHGGDYESAGELNPPAEDAAEKND